MHSIFDLKALLSALVCSLMLVGCGGGGGGDNAKPEINAVTVSVYAGETGATLAELRVYGVQGIFRIAQRAPDGKYVIKLDQLTGPYAVALRFNDDNTGETVYLGSLATRAGVLNLTPFTTFAAAQLFGRDPKAFFAGLGGTGDASLAAVTPAALINAQARVKTFLLRNYGYTVPSGVGDFFTTSFVAQAGDPTFDAITALNTLLAGRGTNVFQVAAQIGNEARLCNAERLGIASADGPRDFCPASKNTSADAGDATITNFTFSDSDGDTLTVSGRGNDVLSATLQPSGGGAPSSCSGAGCAGLTLGTPAGDGTRPIIFAAVRLISAGGTLQLDGTLQANAPGAFFPPLPCDNHYYVAYVDNHVDAACAAPDTSIGAGFGDTGSLGTTRRRYVFQTDGSVQPLAPNIEIVAEPNAIVSVLVQDIDPNTGLPRTLWKCRAAACNGVTLGPVRDDPDSFAPYVLRNRLITLNDTVLSALNPDGSPSSVGSTTVRASLDSFEIIFPPEQQPVTQACGSASQRLVIGISDETRVFEECPPVIVPGLTLDLFLHTNTDGQGNPVYFIGSLLEAFGGNSVSGGITIEMNAGGIASVTYLPILGGRYGCTASECSGITIGAPDGTGQRLITFTGVTLTEVETAGLPGDRTAVINGSFVAPPP
jgi:hypothetical protein